MKSFKEGAKELYLRWKAETPTFWKKIVRIGAALMGFSTLVFGSAYFEHTPEYLITIAKHALSVGAALTFLGKLAVEDKEDIK